MKSFKSLLSVLALGAIFTAGCVVETTVPPPPVCTTNLSKLTVLNYADETVDVTIAGASGTEYRMYSDDIRTDNLLSGTYRVTAVGVTSGLIISDSTSVFDCDSQYELTLTPVQVPVGTPGFAELDVTNDTPETMNIFIDGSFEIGLAPGLTAQFVMAPGNHDVQVTHAATGDLLNSATEFFPVDTVTYWDVSLHIPLVELRNNLSGSGAECVNAFVDTVAVEFDTGFYDVCPTEVGYFGVTIGEHLMEVFGQTSTFMYVNETLDFPDASDTIIQLD